MIIYHHPGCSKSRCALAYLQEQKHTFEIRNYLTEPFTKLELVALLSKLNLLPLAIVRKEELVYKTLIKDDTFQ